MIRRALAGGLTLLTWSAASVHAKVEIAQPLPAVAMNVQALDGSTLDLRSRLHEAAPAGPRAVLLVFWGSWCAPCIREIPVIKELKRFYGPKGLDVIGVALEQEGETLARTAQAVERHGIDYPVYFDARREAAQLFGVTALPAAALINGAGVVAWMGPSLPSDINALIKTALKPGEESAIH